MTTPNGSGGPAGTRKRAATVLTVVAAVLVLLASAVIVYRVLAPAEVVDSAGDGYPAPATPEPGVVGTLNAAPLIVDGRLRVYATSRKVWADQPVHAPTRRTPYWSYRRWPAEVTGVLADGATVVTRWSDGELVALDARTGLVRWRAAGARPGDGYVGRRTGAATVYTPVGLYPAPGPDGSRLLIVAGTTERRGIDVATGRELWRAEVDPACPTGDPAAALTTADGQFVIPETCAGGPVLGFYDVGTGRLDRRWQPTGVPGAGPPAADPDGGTAGLRVTPLGCASLRGDCRGLRTETVDGSRGWLLDRSAPVAAPVLDGPETVLVDDVAVAPAGTGLVARSVRTGVERWRWAGDDPALAPADRRTTIIAVQPGLVHLRTASNDLVTLDAATGGQRSRFPLTYGRDSTAWSPGLVYAGHGFLAVERLAEPVAPDAEDDRYYLSAQPVILAAT